MNKEEIKFIEGYEDLLNKGYCGCNEMNCLGYNSPKEILRIVKKLQQENKQLKDNWNKLKEWIETTNTWYDNEVCIVDMEGYNTNRAPIIWKNSLLFEMQELEDK